MGRNRGSRKDATCHAACSHVISWQVFFNYSNTIDTILKGAGRSNLPTNTQPDSSLLPLPLPPKEYKLHPIRPILRLKGPFIPSKFCLFSSLAHERPNHFSRSLFSALNQARWRFPPVPFLDTKVHDLSYAVIGRRE